VGLAARSGADILQARVDHLCVRTGRSIHLQRGVSSAAHPRELVPRPATSSESAKRAAPAAVGAAVGTGGRCEATRSLNGARGVLRAIAGGVACAVLSLVRRLLGSRAGGCAAERPAETASWKATTASGRRERGRRRLDTRHQTDHSRTASTTTVCALAGWLAATSVLPVPRAPVRLPAASLRRLRSEAQERASTRAR
jgi:hypothetical protein